MRKIFYLTLLPIYLLAIDCSNTNAIKEFNGHYYTITSVATTFDAARIAAQNDGAYLAIPNTAAENDFLKGIIGKGEIAWIGIHDPSKITNYCYEGSPCSYSDSRFRTVNNTTLAYTNWGTNQPDNLVRDNDIIGGKELVAPLGEHWVAMNGNNGQWLDEGNHAESNNNPISYKALFEFDTKPQCFFEDDINASVDLTDKKCNTQLYENTTEILVQGETLDCLLDPHNNYYCPSALAPADTYWSYDDGYSVAHTSTAIDYERGTYSERTGIVRDFVNGTSQPHTNTETNYSSGTSATRTGTVRDWTSGTGTPATAVSIYKDVELAVGSAKGFSRYAVSSAVHNGLRTIPKNSVARYSLWKGKNNSAKYRAYGRIKIKDNLIYNKNSNNYNSGNVWQNHMYAKGFFTNSTNNQISISVDLESYAYDPGSSWTKAFIKETIYTCPSGITPLLQGDNISCPATTSCPAGYTLSGFKSFPIYTNRTDFFQDIGSMRSDALHCKLYAENRQISDYTICKTEITSILGEIGITVTDWSDDGDIVFSSSFTLESHTTSDKCYKDITYNYYSYGCPSGFAVQNAGLTSCGKTDPNTSVRNDLSLASSCNSSTPPANNCVQTLNSTAYQYVCGTGYTPINAGLTSCPSGSSGDCNSAQSPESNCYKDISYKYYSYECPDGYSIDNYGLTSCTKTDPDGTVNNEATLDDPCNTSTPPAGNCQKPIEYTYYEYLCNSEPNVQNEDFQVQDEGLTSCVKTDSDDISNDSSSLGDDCNSETPPTNNCQRQEFTCNSNFSQPVWVDNQWQCSPFPCIGESNVEDLSLSVGSSDKNNDGWDSDGNCNGQLYLFQGSSEKCRSRDALAGLLGGGCCNKDDVFFGLVDCKASEKQLAVKNKSEMCHEIGKFCSKKINLLVSKVCVEDSKSYCCFDSKFARIIHQQGRPQLGISWGNPKNPICRGFTPQEFQKLDMSQMDLSEFTDSIVIPNMTVINDSVKNSVSNHLDNLYNP